MTPEHRRALEAKTFRRYTGVPSGARIPDPRPELLHAAHPGQELLEHQVFLHLRGNGGLSTGHLLGIAWTLPLPDRTVVRLDPVALDTRDHRYSNTFLALQRLLPYQGPEGPTTHHFPGVPGLRVRDIDNAGLHLTLTHHPNSHLVLTGPSPKGWHTRLAQHEADLADSGCQPLWSRTDLAPAEIHWQQHYPVRPWTWVGSGLLRRVGLLTAATNAHTAHFQDRSDEVCISLEHLHPALPAHDRHGGRTTDRLVEHLLDTGWGMPVRVETQHCDCRHTRPDRPHTHDDTYDRHCRTILAHRDGRPGRIQLRFLSTEARAPFPAGLSLAEARDELAGAGAPAKWIRRILPDPAAPTRPLPSLPARRAACTGESLAEAIAAITKNRCHAFPDYTFPQMRLESDIAEALDNLRDRTRNPFGIRALRPAPDHLVVRLDHGVTPARHWARLLFRVPGLRQQIHPDGVHLLRETDEGTARIVLAGMDATLWGLTLAGGPRPAQSPQWSAAETARYQAATDPAKEHHVGSALLRMAGALRGTAQKTSARLSSGPYTDNRGRRHWQWQLDLTGAPDHDVLLDYLTDTSLALGFELREHACRPGKSEGERCTMTLHDGIGQILVVRDHHNPDDDPAPAGAAGRP
ncbi:hypothetical protein [Kitasatospora sp. NPDC088783]|uniref:hypothetical protein n=1 Tax=Kitasatospora sp. NPDC088783 TaxID=3364077 RepID=UPI0037F8C78A